MTLYCFSPCRARPKFSEVAADRLVVRSKPDIQHVADLPLGTLVDLSVEGVADDGTVQVDFTPGITPAASNAASICIALLSCTDCLSLDGFLPFACDL